MRIYCYLSIALIVFIIRPLIAQEDYEKWLQQEQGKFQHFKEERDREFSEFLKREWQQMQIREGLVRDEKPKPVTIPRAEPVAPRKITQPDLEIIKDIPTPKFVPVETPDLKEEEKPIDVTKEKAIEVEYFGIPISV